VLPPITMPPLIFGIALRAESQQLIGFCDLSEIDRTARHARFGIVIGEPDRWGHGHGAEATRLLMRHAFEHLHLNRVWLTVHADHERAIRTYESAGFVREGVLREHAVRRGTFLDEIVMGLLARNWARGK
jgi:RimJ/RimL family protein N-acetyltransferase